MSCHKLVMQWIGEVTHCGIFDYFIMFVSLWDAASNGLEIFWSGESPRCYKPSWAIPLQSPSPYHAFPHAQWGCPVQDLWKCVQGLGFGVICCCRVQHLMG
jgi:hypothetical protein